MSDFSIEKAFPLKEIATFGIGGSASGLIVVHSIEEMQKAVAFCRCAGHNYLVIGKGSNTLFSDEGFDGLILLNKINFCQDRGDGIFHVGAGYSFSLLGTHTSRQGWGGVEFASGIPATVGGAVFMNAGANGQETSEHITSIEYIDATGTYQRRLKAELSFGYRRSAFQAMPGSAIVAATFQLTPSADARLRQQKIIAYRKKSQPLADKSAGCIFKNPPHCSAGALIEECGLKGAAIGGAEVSPVHANFIVNRGHATARDVLDLIALIKAGVKTIKGIELEAEIQHIPHKFGKR